MANYRYLAVTIILLFSGFIGSSTSISHDNYQISTNYFFTPQTGSNSFDEGISVSVGEDGNIWSNYWIHSSTVSFDATELESLIPSQYLNFIDGIDIHFNPREQNNVYLRISFMTSNYGLAEEYSSIIVSAITSGTLFEFIHERSYSYQYWDSAQQKIGTTVEFAATIDINHLVPYLIDTVADHNLISQFNYSRVYDVGLNIWNYDGDFTASLNFYFDSDFDQPDGGHLLSLNDLLGMTEFKSTLSFNPFSIEIYLPQATNYAFVGLSEGPNLDLGWYVHGDDYVRGTITLLNGQSLDTIEISFDYSFVLRQWRNRDSIYWDVNQRGYEQIDLDVNGRHRLIPHPDLAFNSSILENVLELNFQLSSAWNEGYFHLTFNTTSYRETEFNQVISVLSSLGVNMYNASIHNATTTWYDWIDNQRIDYDARTYWVDFDIFPSNFTTIVDNFRGNSNSALLSVVNLDYFNTFRFNLFNDKWGLYPRYSIEYNPDDSPIPPMDQIPSFTNGTQNVDVLNLPFLTIVDDFPWNENSEELNFHFDSPYDGNEDIITVSPNNQWGKDWWSNLWLDQKTYPHVHYDVNIYTSDPRINDVNGNPTGVAPEFLLSFNAEFASVDTDLSAPDIFNTAWRDFNQPNLGYGNANSYPRNFPTTLSGDIELMTVVQDYGADGWWYNSTGNTWVERYPSSGIADVNGFLVREDTPFNHDIFKTPLNFNFAEVWEPGESDVYTTSFDSTNFADGWYELMIDTSDNAGNSDTKGGTYLVIDNYDDATYNASNLTLGDLPSYGEVVEGNLTINFSTEDDTGIYAAIVWVNGGGFLVEPSSTIGDVVISQEFSFVLNTEAYDDGTPLFIWVEVLDYDGHWTVSDDFLVFAGEPAATDPPKITLIAPNGDFEHDASDDPTITFTVDITDDWGTYQPVLNFIDPSSGTKSFTMTAESAKRYSIELTVSNWVSGVYTWYVEVTDIGLNENTVKTASFNMIIVNGAEVADTESPTLNILQPSDLSGLSGEVTFEVEAYDNVAVQQVTLQVYEFSYTMNSDVNGRYLYTVDTSRVPDGEYELTITATDTSGNTANIVLQVSFENGNDKAPDIGLPFQVPWMLVLFSMFGFITIRKKKYS